MKRKIGTFLFAFSLVAATAWAHPEDAASKLGRGLSNTAFGWFDILNEMGNALDREGPGIGIPSGFLRGTFFAAARTLAGIYEVITFPLPNGKKGYQPLILPESVFSHR